MRARLPAEVGARRADAGSDGAVRFDDQPGAPCCQGDELRCGCGSLLARIVGSTVELKCRRCKRVWNIPVEKS